MVVSRDRHSLSRTEELNMKEGYTPVAKLLHWLVVVLLFSQYVVAWNLPHMGRDTVPNTVINLHFSLGVLIFLVLIVRLAWRWTHPEPAPDDGLSPWQVTSARVMHYFLYAMLMVIPLLGWMNASYRGLAVSFFGIITLPQLIATRTPEFAWTGDAHIIAAYYIMLPVAGLHIAVALYHWLVRKDGVMQRMLPG
jgi:cytochrome b561